MAKVLIVKAHPLDRQASYVLRALEDLVQLYQTRHPQDQIELVDVFNTALPSLDKNLLEAMGLAKKGLPLTQEQERVLASYTAYTDQFLQADKIIIVNPLWNLNVPSQLVSWINTINVAGRTFQYGPEGAVGLVKDKKVLHIQSNGGVYAGADPASQYIRSIFAFLGFEKIHQVFIEGQSAQPDQAETIYEKAMEQIRQILEVF